MGTSSSCTTKWTFFEAGNGYRYEFIPKDEIWLDGVEVQPGNAIPILYHEAYESRLMAGGMSYGWAHYHANGSEWLLRQQTLHDPEPVVRKSVKKDAMSGTHVPTVAVDLDGTLAEYHGWKGEDSFGAVRPGAREAMAAMHDAGARLIIFTTRGNKDKVRGWLERNAIPFDFINENPDQPADGGGKVIADVYLDDRAINAKGPWEGILAQTMQALRKPDALQPVAADCGYDVLSTMAAGALPQLWALLDGYRRTDMANLTPPALREALAPPGVIAVVPLIKARERATEKVTADYGGDWRKLVDVLRASVTADTVGELRQAISELSERAPYARPPKDRLDNPRENGYRDFLANYVLPGGFVCEVQFHLKPMMIAREEQLAAYHSARTGQSVAAADQVGRDRMEATWRNVVQ